MVTEQLVNGKLIYYFFMWSVSQHIISVVPTVGRSENFYTSENYGHEGWKELLTALNAISWSRLLMWLHHVFFRCRFSSELWWLTKWKLNLQWFHSWRIPHHSRWWPKMMTLLWKKAGNLFLFSKSLKWVTGGQ